MEDEAGSAYRSFERGCSPHLRQQLQRLAAAPAESWPGGLQPHYCLVEIHDGQYPALRICPTVSSLLQQLNKLVDQDVCVVPFYGLPIEYSTGPQRIIVLPDDTAWEFYPGMQRVARWEAQLDLQDNYYLGPAALAEPAAPLTSLLPGPLPGPTPPPASAAGEDPAGTPA